MTTDQMPTDEQQAKDQLLFALHHRDKPTLAFVECKSTAKRDELEVFLQQELTEYSFYAIDLTSLTVTSLLRTLDENLPVCVKDSLPVTCVVNVHGLENRLDEHLAAQLNLERELLFRNVPYVTLIWADAYFFRKLQRLAPDLWHWVTYKFRFDDPLVSPIEQLSPLPTEALPQRGDINERRQRIHALEGRYSRLDLNDTNKIRLLRDKINILSLLGQEYAEAFEYKKAIRAYQTAIALEQQVQEGTEREGKMQRDDFLRSRLLINLGWAYFNNRSFEEALAAYNQSKDLQSESAYDTIYCFIGMVYAEQRQWMLALENYVKAIEWNQKTGQVVSLGIIYYYIGRVYAEQRQWAAALDNYSQALQWYQRTGNASGLGSAYHEIGIVYAQQRQWPAALSNYELALKWKKEAGDLFNLGGTYHQIGMAYAEQGQWAAALDNYSQAIESNQQTGGTLHLGSAYHEIGIVYAKQQQWTAALDSYTEAIKWNQQTSNTIEIGRSYHQIGMLYAEQKQWTEALNYYQQALKSKQQTGNIYELGSTYHCIEKVYAEQEQWAIALESYAEALKWNQQTNNTFELGITYQQIGKLYATQQQWGVALENYEQALAWNRRVGNLFSISGCYFDIGLVCTLRQQWAAALFNFEQSLDWQKKTGNISDLGTTYYVIGLVYADQGKLAESLDWFKRAVANLVGHTLLPKAEKKLAELISALSSQIK